MSCHKPIKISKIDNPAPGQKKKWERFELDGVTPHQCTTKKKGGGEEKEISGIHYNTQIAEVTKQVSDLNEKMNVIISQVQMLRSEVKAKK